MPESHETPEDLQPFPEDLVNDDAKAVGSYTLAKAYIDDIVKTMLAIHHVRHPSTAPEDVR
jgi:hypothetical protein